MSLDVARRVADTILYEGYVLYPYRASSQKNRLRWQFGVLAPRRWSEAGSNEPWVSQTECLLEPERDSTMRFTVRFLQAQHKSIEAPDERGNFAPVESLVVGDVEHFPWDEGAEQEIQVEFALSALLNGEQTHHITLHGMRQVERLAAYDHARVVRRSWPVAGTLRVSAEAIPGPYGLVRLRARLENDTDWGDAEHGREEALRHSMLAAHILIQLDSGSFISLLDPPEWARFAAETCRNEQTWPVLIGDEGSRNLMLSSPIILYDYPQIAPESPGDLYDATEIDEILTLRTLALTDAEKREARATDPRAAAVIDRVDSMPKEVMDRLHGAIRYLRSVTGDTEPSPVPEAPWWDPGADASVDPETDSIMIGDTPVSKGARVRLTPGARRADAQDMFLAGKPATVQAVIFDVDNGVYLAVTLDDDPMADLQVSHGRFLYFAPDEVEVLGVAP